MVLYGWGEGEKKNPALSLPYIVFFLFFITYAYNYMDKEI